MFSCRISPISLHLSLFLSSFVNCYVYMIVRSSLKNNYLYYNRQIKKFPTEKQNVSLKHILT